LSENFANQVTALATEEFGDGSKAHQTIVRSMNGEAWAHADYRVFLATDTPTSPPLLCDVSESDAGSPCEHFNFDGKFYSRSFLNYLLGLNFLKKNVETQSINRVLEIGGGFGTLGEILHQSGEFAYVDVDIPPTSAVANYYLSSTETHSVIPYSQTRTLENIDYPEAGQSMVLCPWQLPKLKGKIDLAVNFISFQEMEPEIVENYLSEIDRLEATYVLLRNMREGKRTLAQGAEYGVEIPILSDDYDRFLPNYNLLNTNVHPYGYETVDGFHSELRLYRRK